MKVGFLSTIIVSALFCAPAYAQNTAECVKLKDPDDRLNCFDRLFVTSGKIDNPTTDWQVTVETSTLDDSAKVIMSLDSKDPLRNQFGQVSTGSFLIRCEENTTSAYFIFGGHFMSDIQGSGRIDFRIDTNDPRHANMSVSTDNQALGLWRGNNAITFIRLLFEGKSLLIRATPFSESRVEMTFNISGIEEEIAPLREACKW